MGMLYQDVLPLLQDHIGEWTDTVHREEKSTYVIGIKLIWSQVLYTLKKTNSNPSLEELSTVGGVLPLECSPSFASRIQLKLL